MGGHAIYTKAWEAYYDSSLYEMRTEKKTNSKPRVALDKKWKTLKVKGLKSNRSSKLVGQAQSKFLSLPVEIRIMIFELVVGPQNIFVDQNGTRISGFLQDRGCCRPMQKCVYQRGEKLQVTHLMQTCQLVHSDLSSVVYGRSNFIFQDLRPLIYFTTDLPAHNLDQITSMHIEARWNTIELPIELLSIPGHGNAQPLVHFEAARYKYLTTRPKGRPRWPFGQKGAKPNVPIPSLWGAICDDLSRMRSLRDLSVEIRLFSDRVEEYRSYEDYGRFIIEPLAMVKKVRGDDLHRAELIVDWDLYTDIGDLHGLAVTRVKEVERFPLRHYPQSPYSR
ncbi:hypothetical protein P154DRAFT_518958 [Amniculicola lignicola CBS 123094]|uniref:DUF7730 domain-containing protein n=1 Tax=Amniculicola lignicola CBS 123094 TaxID=1392246 RepID=A0A6A5X251_9PLEO|nr:hypothetical protein P154DRAFT_518958 [Amniculicola lignicola CBS 123094]